MFLLWALLRAGLLGLIAAATFGPACAADYYAGKSVDLVVGNAPGGGFDIYARAIAPHLTRHIPGSPAIVVKNMPGAGGARVGHYISTVAAKDGLTIGAMMPGTIVGPLLDDKPDTSFDPTKVAYLGTANTGTYICATLDHSKTKTFEQLLTRRTVMGGVAAGNSVTDVAYLVKKMTGAQLDIITGYKGTVELTLAMERGELDGMCGWNWSSAKSQKPDWIRDGRLNLMAQIGLEPNPELTKIGVPEIWHYIKGEENRKVAETVVSQQAFERPYFTASGTPDEVVTTLRAAFDATLRDPQFLADAQKMGIDVSPLPGTQVQAMVEKLYATPKNIVERAKAAIKP
jgi:tripartite-type tricarboxylate transporter receptor subunit TctC